MDHDERMSAGSAFVSADLSRDATRRGFRSSHSAFDQEFNDRSNYPYTANIGKWDSSDRKACAGLFRLWFIRFEPNCLETNRADIHSGSFRHDGLWSNRRVPCRSLSSKD